SLSSMASFSPVEAPEGTSAEPVVPSSRTTLASTVGLPRESNSSAGVILLIRMLIPYNCSNALFVQARDTWQFLALKKLQRRTAAGRDMRDSIGNACSLNR